MDANNLFIYTFLTIACISLGQVMVNKAQNDLNKSMSDFMIFNADRIDELVTENKNLQKKVDLLENCVYNSNME
jgi:hypothetical protein